MAIKIIDEVQYELYSTLLSATLEDIDRIDDLLSDLKFEARRLAQERKKYYIEDDGKL